MKRTALGIAIIMMFIFASCKAQENIDKSVSKSASGSSILVSKKQTAHTSRLQPKQLLKML